MFPPQPIANQRQEYFRDAELYNGHGKVRRLLAFLANIGNIDDSDTVSGVIPADARMPGRPWPAIPLNVAGKTRFMYSFLRTLANSVSAKFSVGSGRSSRKNLEALIKQLNTISTQVEARPTKKNLHRQIAICEQALGLLPSDSVRELSASDPVRELIAKLQSTKGIALGRLGEHTGHRSTLERSLKALTEAAQVRSRQNAPMVWAYAQTNLAGTLLTIGDLFGDAAALRNAETACREALSEYSPEKTLPEWTGTNNNLGTTLQHLGALTGDIGKILEAEKILRATLRPESRSEVPLLWAMTSNGLGNVLAILGEITGDISTLQRSCEAYAAALQVYTRETEPEDWADAKIDMGNALSTIGEMIGDSSLLERSLNVYGEVRQVSTRREAPLRWAMLHTNIATALLNLGSLTDASERIQESVSAYREALRVYTRKHTPRDWAANQTNLGNALGLSGERNRNARQLKQSEAAFRAALKVYNFKQMPADWANLHNNIGTAIMRRAELARDPKLVRDAVELYRTALKGGARERAPINWAMTHNNLAVAFETLWTLTKDDHVLNHSERAYQESIDSYAITGDHDRQQATARRFAQLLVSRGDYVRADAVIERAISLSDAALIEASRSAAGRSRAVDLVGDLYALQSLCRLHGSKRSVDEALVCAAAGRARLLADTLRFNSLQIEEISDSTIRDAINSTQARRVALRQRLGFESANDGVARPSLTSDECVALMKELSEVGETYIALCRRHGLVKPLEAPSLTSIVEATPQRGAMVLPVLTQSEAFAFVIIGETKQVAVVPLDGICRGDVLAQFGGANGWISICEDHFRGNKRGSQRAAALAAERWRLRLQELMIWLWERLLGPIDNHLRNGANLEPGASVTMLPPGLLGLLPLHAACPAPEQRTFGDLWVVNYAPSVHALAECSKRARAFRSSKLRLLAILDPDGSLLAARAEGEMLRRRFAGVETAPAFLLGADATRTAVVSHLSEASVIHASTHGRHYSTQPARSGLDLADAVLTLEDLRLARFAQTRLVFLAACESGLSGVRELPDEFVGLPACFLETGAACVIGSLWLVYDNASFLIASRFYAEWLDDMGRERVSPVGALSTSLAWLRSVTFRELRTQFPVERNRNGDELILCSTSSGDEINTLRISLGSDEERPFSHPEYWAGFTCTGK